jgi:hypothetical protein
VALAIIETYLNRKLEWATDTESFTHKTGCAVSLRRYPLTDVLSVNMNENNQGVLFHADEENGILHIDGYTITHVLTVVYEGGYLEADTPADLKWCILQAFDLIYQNENAGTGAAGALVKSIASDGANIQYDLTTSVATAKAMDFVNGLPMNTTAILENYRRILC